MSKPIKIQLEWPSFQKLYLGENFDESKYNKKSIFIGTYYEIKLQKNSKDYNLKIINVQQSHIDSFKAYLFQLYDYMDLMEMTRQNSYLFKIEAFSIHETTFYIVQKRHDQPIKKMEELQAFVVLRALVQFYNQICQQQLKKLFDMFNELRVVGPSVETVFYYYNSSKQKKKLNRSKIKLDLLKFKEINENIKKNKEENFLERIHMRELADLMVKLLESENMRAPGICTRTLLNRIFNDKVCVWEKIFLHPIFCQDKTITPDYGYWKINENDRNYMRDEERKANTVDYLHKKSKKDFDHPGIEENVTKTVKQNYGLRRDEEEKGKRISPSKMRNHSANPPYKPSEDDLKYLKHVLNIYKDNYTKLINEKTKSSEFNEFEEYIIVAIAQYSELTKKNVQLLDHPSYKATIEFSKKNKKKYKKLALEELLAGFSFLQDKEKHKIINLLSNLKVI